MIGVRSKYTIDGVAGATLKNIIVTITEGSQVHTYNYSKEVKNGQSLDIAPIVRDYIAHEKGVASSVSVKVTYNKTTTNGTENITINFDAVDGYLFYNEPKNSDLYQNKKILLSSDEMKIGGDEFYFFFYAENNGEKLRYVSYPSEGINESDTYIKGLHKIVINGYSSDDYLVISSGGQEVVLKIEQENKYNTNVVEFLNKYGVWEMLFFTKKESASMNIEGNEFRTFRENEFVPYNVNGRDKISLNTFWIPEEMNKTITQLLLSEEVYLNGEKYNVDQKSVNYKTRVNDNLISYEIQFINSNNLIR